MRIGVIFPCNEIGGDNGAIRAYVQAAEDLGFTHFEVFDHVVGEPDNYAGRLWREPFVLLAHLAALTTTIELTTGIIILPQRQTALVAKQAAEVDLWSEGRLRLGLGVGWNPFEYLALDQDFSTRGRRMDAQIDALRTLWSEPVVDVTIGREQISGGGLDPRPNRDIPIWIGGRSPAAMRRAVTKGHGWLSNFQDHLANDRAGLSGGPPTAPVGGRRNAAGGFRHRDMDQPGPNRPRLVGRRGAAVGRARRHPPVVADRRVAQHHHRGRAR